MCKKDPPGPLSETLAQKLGRLGVAYGRLGAQQKTWCPVFPSGIMAVQTTMVRGESAAGLGCKGGFGELISVLNDLNWSNH